MSMLLALHGPQHLQASLFGRFATATPRSLSISAHIKGEQGGVFGIIKGSRRWLIVKHIMQVTSEANTEYLKALADRCVAKQQQTEAALR